MKQLIHLVIFILFITHVKAQDSLQVELEPYKLSEISSAIESSNTDFRNAKLNVQNAGNISNLHEEFEKLVSKNQQLRNDTAADWFAEQTIQVLDGLQKKWSNYRDEIGKIEKNLDDLSKELDQFEQLLSTSKTRWDRTKILAEESETVDAITERIDLQLAFIREQSDFSGKLRTQTYLLMDSITQENLFIGEIGSAIRMIKEEKRKQLFIKDSPGFFEMFNSRQDTLPMSARFSENWDKAMEDNSVFLRDNKLKVIIHFLIFILVTMLFYYLKITIKKIPFEEHNSLILFNSFLKSPYLASFIFCLTLYFWYYDNQPRLLNEQIVFILIFPIGFVLSSVTDRDDRIAIFLVAFMLMIEQIQNINNDFEYQRIMMMAGSLIALGITLYLVRPKSSIYTMHNKSLEPLSRIFVLVPLLLIISIYCNYNGSVLLSKLILSALVRVSAVGLVLYIFIGIIEGLVNFIVRSKLNESVYLFSSKPVQIMYWTKLVARTWAMFIWLKAVINSLQLADAFSSWWEEIMQFGWVFGEVSLTVEIVVNFILILVFFSLTASFIKALLEIEILPRLDLKKGIPLAIAVMTRYTILVLGFFMAVAATGISLDKLGFLAGALGVGIGFGLQNVVGNFVSGLILIFERPIHIDDVITAGDIEGIVREIGIRSSKIQTYDGAVVVLPNNDLISNRVTNWTYSDTKRRREKKIYVELGNEPNKVIEVIKVALNNTDDVLKDPNPMILFLGYKEYAMEFRILYWLGANLLLGDSEVALGIHTALSKEGIQIAVPRQKVVFDEKTSEKKAVGFKKGDGSEK